MKTLFLLKIRLIPFLYQNYLLYLQSIIIIKFSSMKTETYKEEIDNLTHEEMCNLWRNGGGKPEWFDNRCEESKYFYDRLFVHFGGFTPEISKKIGWKKYE